MSAGRGWALVFGLLFLLAGIAGYVPQLAKGSLLLGYFQVNAMHNMVHIFTGIVAIFASIKGSASRLFFQAFGVIYGLVAVLGFMHGEIAGMPVNMADNWLHAVIALVSLYLGFVFKKF